MQSQLLHYLKDRPWLAAVLTAALCFVVIYAVFGQPGFETNDDVIMAMVPLLIVIAVITFWLTSQRIPLSMALSVLIALTILSIFIMLYAKLPARVYASILQFTAPAFALHCSPKAVGHLFSNKVTGATTIAFAGIVVLQPWLWYWDNSRYLADYQRKELLKFTDKLRSEKNRLIIIWTGELPIECIGLFQNPASYFGGLKLVALNSMMNSPIFYHRLAQFGIENFIRQLDHPAVLLITRDFTMNCIEDYLIDKHSIRPIFEPQMESNALGIRAYKVVFTDDPNRPDTDLSRLCPVPRSEDVIIFPVQADSGYTCRFMDCESISEKGEKTDFRITGRHPRISIKLDRKPQSLEEVSHLFVEIADLY